MVTPSPSAVTLFPLSAAFRPSAQERFCRLCMDNRQTAKLQHFFFDGEPVNPDLLEGIRTLINIKIVLPDDQHARICSRCLRSLEDFFYFRERCQAVDLRVRERRAKRSSQPSPMSAAEVPVCVVPSHPPPEPEECQVVESMAQVATTLDTVCVFESTSYLQDLSDEPERVLNIQTYQKEEDPEMPNLPVPAVNEPCSSFFLCIERGLSMVHRGYYYILSQVRFEGGSCTWQCSWNKCKVTLETNAQLTTFQSLSEHAHSPPNRSDLDEAVGSPISQDRAFAELAACPAKDYQTVPPEVTFYRPAKAVIGVRYDGFHFRLGGFLAGGKSRWNCTWHGCSIQLELTGTLDCRLVPVDKHGHPRPNGPVCSVVNIISPVKALIELNWKRGMTKEQQPQQQDEQIVREILEGKRQPQIVLTKVKLPCLARQMAIRRNAPRASFFRSRRTIGMMFEGHHFDLAKYSKNGSSWWKCDRKSSDVCQVRIALDPQLDLLSIHPDKHHHRRFRCLPTERLRGEQISAEEVIEELRNNSGARRSHKKAGMLESLNGRRIVTQLNMSTESASTTTSTSTSCSSLVYSTDSF